MKLRLGYYSDTDALGGSEVYLQTLLSHIEPEVFEVFVFCPSNHPLVPWINEQKRFHIIFLDDKGKVPAGNQETSSMAPHPSLSKNPNVVKKLWNKLPLRSLKLFIGTLRDIFRLRKFLKEHPVDILHFNDTGCEPPVMAARLAGIRHILGTLHVIPSEDKAKLDWVRRLIEYGSMHALHETISVSKAVKIAWMKRTRVRSRKIHVIYNGVDLTKFRLPNPTEIRVLRNSLGIKDNQRLVAVPARLHPMKGHKYLLEAIPKIKSQVPDVKFLFIGDGPLKEELISQAKATNILEDILFLGFRKDIYDLMAISELVVLPSVALEALAYVLIEAQALSKPVVATNFSGLPEVVQNGITGLLVLRGSAEALSKAILELFNDQEKAKKMGEAGRKRVERLFTQEQMLEQTFRFYTNYHNAEAENLRREDV